MKKLSLLPKLILATALLISMPLSLQADEAADVQRLLDIAAINSVVSSYMRAYDSMDEEAYPGIFTEDANLAGMQGRDAIHQYIVNVRKEREEAKAKGEPVWVYHVMSNSEITDVTDTEAHHQAYWTVVTINADGELSPGSIGRYEDLLVKQSNGEWLIADRKITTFGPGNE